MAADSPGRLLRTVTLFRLATAVGRVSCAEHRRKRLPFHCYDIGNKVVELQHIN